MRNVDVPHGIYVAATRANELVALTPSGEERWSLARPAVRFPRWAGTATDTRIAYLTRSRLHVVRGDGTKDVDECGEPGAARVAPAWRPGDGFVLPCEPLRCHVHAAEQPLPFARPEELVLSAFDHALQGPGQPAARRR